MSGNAKDETGKRYGRLVVLGRAGSNGRGLAMWLCLCDCGNEAVVGGHRMRSGNTRSCGCLNDEARRKVAAKNGRKGAAKLRGLRRVDDAEISYRGHHDRIKSARGPASEYDCVDCGQAAEEWAYIYGCEAEREGASGKRSDVLYCPHVEHYEPRCHSCHVSYDHDHKPKERVTV